MHAQNKAVSRANHAPFPPSLVPLFHVLPSFFHTAPPSFLASVASTHCSRTTTSCLFAQLEISFTTSSLFDPSINNNNNNNNNNNSQNSTASTKHSREQTSSPTYPSIMDTDSPLTVVIISPTHSPHRFTLDLASKSTILHLKDLIALRLQDGADALLTATDQRLIYGGRILEDSETLDGIFEKVSSRSLLTEKETSNSHSNPFPCHPITPLSRSIAQMHRRFTWWYHNDTYPAVDSNSNNNKGQVHLARLRPFGSECNQAGSTVRRPAVATTMATSALAATRLQPRPQT